MSGPIVVLKLGGSVLLDDGALRLAVGEIYRHVRAGERVVAVVSAQGGTTDTLLERVRCLAPRPNAEFVAAFLATGEARSAAALALSADAAGIPTALLEPRQLGLEVLDGPQELEPVGLATSALRDRLEDHRLVVVPGFVGVDRRGELRLLGRGGSDLTALFLAAELEAQECVLVKDVDGWFTADPRLDPAALTYRNLSWQDAIAAPSPIVQDRAVRTAQKARRSFVVRARGSEAGTRVGGQPTTCERVEKRQPLRVVVLGAGTVGTEVIRCLVELPERYEIRAILVRSLDRPRASCIPRERLTDDPSAAELFGADLVVDTLIGVEPARQILQAAQSAGAAVVTANKEARVALGRGLRGLGDAATVGGGAPFLEAVYRVARSVGVGSLRGILNGTCNAILDDIGKGATVEAAIARARAGGFAEEDLSADLSGQDVVRKLTILAGACGVDFSAIDWQGVEAIAAAELGPLGRGGARQIATLRFDGGGPPRASVRLERLSATDPLGGLAGEWNRLEIVSRSGHREVVSGRGAGGVPTATAVFADIEDAWRSLAVPAYRQVNSAPPRSPVEVSP